MIKVIIELDFEKISDMKAEGYRNMAFDEIYNGYDVIDLSHCEVKDTESDFLK